MKTSRMLQLLMAGIIFSISLAAFAVAGDTMMNEKKMGNMEMKDDGMKGDAMMSDHRVAMLAGSDGHHAAGKVSFVEEMGKTTLVLSGIKVDKVPDGHVYLARNGDRKKGIDLGILKQFTGKVAFTLPADADPAAYDSVIIYCEKFNVEIGRAKFAKTM